MPGSMEPGTITNTVLRHRRGWRQGKWDGSRNSTELPNPSGLWAPLPPSKVLAAEGSPPPHLAGMKNTGGRCTLQAKGCPAEAPTRSLWGSTEWTWVLMEALLSISSDPRVGEKHLHLRGPLSVPSTHPK